MNLIITKEKENVLLGRLMYCAHHGFIWGVPIIEEGQRHLLHTRVLGRMTLLDIAISNGRVPVAKFFFDIHGVRTNANLYVWGRFSPVHHAAENGCSPAIFQWALDAGIVPTLRLRDSQNRTPYDVVVSKEAKDWAPKWGGEGSGDLKNNRLLAFCGGGCTADVCETLPQESPLLFACRTSFVDSGFSVSLKK